MNGRSRIGQIAGLILLAMLIAGLSGCGLATNGQSIIPNMGAEVCVENDTDESINAVIYSGSGVQVGNIRLHSFRDRCDDIPALDTGDTFRVVVETVGGPSGYPPAFRNLSVQPGLVLEVRKGGQDPYDQSTVDVR